MHKCLVLVPDDDSVRLLSHELFRRFLDRHGYRSDVTIYECEDCTSCPYKEKYTRTKEINAFMYPKTSLKRDRNPMKIS